jgi:ArsR family transcriptional regulator, arsenate/arsenite/antimonite-responsive transcriptional repressor
MAQAIGQMIGTCVAPLQGSNWVPSMKDEETLNMLRVISQDSRWDIVAFLASRAEACATEISVEVGIPPSTLSFHLKQLADAKVLEARAQGREIYYRFKAGQLEKAVESLKYLLMSP